MYVLHLSSVSRPLAPQANNKPENDEVNSALFLRKKLGTDLRRPGEEPAHGSSLDFAERMRLAQLELELQEAQQAAAKQGGGPKPPLYLRKKEGKNKAKADTESNYTDDRSNNIVMQPAIIS